MTKNCFWKLPATSIQQHTFWHMYAQLYNIIKHNWLLKYHDNIEFYYKFRGLFSGPLCHKSWWYYHVNSCCKCTSARYNIPLEKKTYEHLQTSISQIKQHHLKLQMHLHHPPNDWNYWAEPIMPKKKHVHCHVHITLCCTIAHLPYFQQIYFII